jgi:hypothetical protein
MPVTPERAEFIKQPFRIVESGPNGSVLSKYGEAARKMSEPVPTFFESAVDALAMATERMVLLANDRRKFTQNVSGCRTGINLSYTETAPILTVKDEQRSADHPAVVAEFAVDFSKQQTSIVSWGGDDGVVFSFRVTSTGDFRVNSDDSFRIWE